MKSLIYSCPKPLESQSSPLVFCGMEYWNLMEYDLCPQNSNVIVPNVVIALCLAPIASLSALC